MSINSPLEVKGCPSTTPWGSRNMLIHYILYRWNSVSKVRYLRCHPKRSFQPLPTPPAFWAQLSQSYGWSANFRLEPTLTTATTPQPHGRLSKKQIPGFGAKEPRHTCGARFTSRAELRGTSCVRGPSVVADDCPWSLGSASGGPRLVSARRGSVKLIHGAGAKGWTKTITNII